MKKIIICAAILLTSGITAWSFNKKDNGIKAREEATEKTHFTTKSVSTPISDISTAD